MTDPVLTIGTRGSLLATTQSRWVGEKLSATIGVPAELSIIRTEGDDTSKALTQIGGTGVFVSAVRDALLAGRVDLAVHSLKDLPTAPAAGIALAAVPQREDPSDVLVARDGLTLATLPNGARVGTGSPRRAALLRVYRPDLNVRPIRGNVDTRVGFVRSGDLDAVVLAAAGLRRVGRESDIAEVIAPEIMLPAPGQGALAVECRLEERATAWFASALAKLDHPTSRSEVTAERNLLATLEAGCSAPVGARAVADADTLTLRAVVVDPATHQQWADEITGPVADAAKLGRILALTLLDAGAGQVTAARS